MQNKCIISEYGSDHLMFWKSKNSPWIRIRPLREKVLIPER